MRTSFTLATALLLSSALAQQQQRPASIAGGLEIGIPIGEFDDTWGRQMVGLSANMTIPMRRLPLYYGFDLSWHYMGSKRVEVAVNEEGIASTTGNLSVRSNAYGYHALLRLQPFTGKVSPYVEALGGLRQFTTRTEINVDNMDLPIMEQRNENAFIGSGGWAAGLQVTPGKSKNFLLEMRVERLDGGRVTYVDPDAIEVSQDNEVSYGTLSSGVRVVNITFGIGLRF